MTILRVVLILIIGFLLVFLSLQNYNIITTVQVFHRQYYNVSLSIVMLYAFAFGLLTIGIFAAIDEIRLRSRLHKQKKERDALFEELKALRNISIGLEEKEKK
jgi:cytochrome c biogenesis protein CcdA